MSRSSLPSGFPKHVYEPIPVFGDFRKALHATLPYVRSGSEFRIIYERLVRQIINAITKMKVDSPSFKLAWYRIKQLHGIVTPVLEALEEWNGVHRQMSETQRQLGEVLLPLRRGDVTPAFVAKLDQFLSNPAHRAGCLSSADVIARVPGLASCLLDLQPRLRLFIRLWTREVTGRIDATAADLMSPEYLVLRDLRGRTAFHVLAEHGDLDTAPNELLTKENLLACDPLRWTPLHYAAENGHLGQIPPILLTEQNLLLTNGAGWNCMHLAFAAGHGSELPASAITQAALSIQVGKGVNCFHLAAMSGAFSQVPLKLQTLENVLKEDHRRQNCLHYAAAGGHLWKLPWQCRPVTAMTIRDAMGYSALDYAARYRRAHSK